MSKLRLLFIKEAQASYISHLDLMRMVTTAGAPSRGVMALTVPSSW
jgi:hypothetical protein